MNTDNRKVHVRNSSAYFNCLGEGHRTKDCKSTGHCQKCSKLHHTLLHRDQASNESDETKSSLPVVPSDNSSSVVPSDNSSSGAALHHINPQLEIQTSLSMTSQVVLKVLSGKHVVARILLDSGAGISLVSQRIVKQLQLQKSSCHISITGAVDASVGSVSDIVNLTIVPKDSKQLKLNLEAAVVPGDM